MYPSPILRVLLERVEVGDGDKMLWLPHNYDWIQHSDYPDPTFSFVNIAPDREVDGVKIWDFTSPAKHHYLDQDRWFWQPASFPEDCTVGGYFHRYTPKKTDLVFDLGANSGVTACHFSDYAGTVLAVEPDDENYAYLSRNFSLYPRGKRLANRYAVGGSCRTAKFRRAGWIASGLFDPGEGHPIPNEVVDVEVVTLAWLIERFGVPAFIKMDIEGAEIETLEGARDVLRQNAVHFAIESHRLPDGEFNTKVMEKIFRECGYEANSEFIPLVGWITHARK